MKLEPEGKADSCALLDLLYLAVLAKVDDVSDALGVGVNRVVDHRAARRRVVVADAREALDVWQRLRLHLLHEGLLRHTLLEVWIHALIRALSRTRRFICDRRHSGVGAIAAGTRRRSRGRRKLTAKCRAYGEIPRDAEQHDGSHQHPAAVSPHAEARPCGHASKQVRRA